MPRRIKAVKNDPPAIQRRNLRFGFFSSIAAICGVSVGVAENVACGVLYGFGLK